jgi:hypothetical protein
VVRDSKVIGLRELKAHYNKIIRASPHQIRFDWKKTWFNRPG